MNCLSGKPHSKKGYFRIRNPSKSILKFISCLKCKHSKRKRIQEANIQKPQIQVKPDTLFCDDVFIPETSCGALRKMIKDFSYDCSLGEGKFGTVYRTRLKSGREVAVKVVMGHNLSIPNFKKQVAAINQLQNPHLAELLSYTCSEKYNALFFEFAPYGSLYDILHGKYKNGHPDVQGSEKMFVLSWNQRVRIALDVANGLRYLHEFRSTSPLTHKGLKSSNILIFKGFRAKITDFDLDVTPLNRSTMSSGVLGSFGYNAPESEMMGKFTTHTDVYSFGIILLELLTGRKPINHKMPKSQVSLVKWVIPKLNSSNLDQCIDPGLKGTYSEKDSYRIAELASKCVNFEHFSRPSMSQVVTILSDLCIDF